MPSSKLARHFSSAAAGSTSVSPVPKPTLRLSLSSSSFLHTVLTDGRRAPVYAVDTEGPRTSLTRIDWLQSSTRKVAGIHWPTVSRAELSEAPVTYIAMNGETVAIEQFLKWGRMTT